MEYPVLDAKATGARIKELRVAHHLKVEDIARFMGFESEQAVYKWQRGDSLPTVDNLYALSKLFGTSVDEILIGEKDESPSLSVFNMIKSFKRRSRMGIVVFLGLTTAMSIMISVIYGYFLR